MPLAPPPTDLLPVFNAQPGATLLLSPEWVILGASDDYLAATLTQRAALVGRYIFDAFPDNPDAPEADGVAKVRASLEQVLATKQPHDMAPQHYDVPDRTHPGRFVERHWQPRHTPVLDAAGQVQYIIQSVQDITAHRLAERQLHESQAAEQAAHVEAEQQRHRFREALMQLPAYVAAYHGPDHVYQFVNPTYQSVFPLRAFPGRPLRDAMPEATGLGIVALFDRVYQTGEPHHVPELEGWFDFQDTGEPEQVFLNVYLQPLRNAQGRIDGVLDYSHNVTEQVRARRQVEQLHQQVETARAEAERGRAQLHALLTQAPVAIALLQGDDLRVVSANDLITELWGYTPADVLGRPLLEGVPELQGQGFDDLLRDVMRTQVPFVGKETAAVMLRHGQLQTSYFDFVYHPQYDAGGQVQGVIIVATDMTEQVRSRQQVEQLNAELETRVQQRTQEALALQADLLAAAQRQAQERDAQRGELQRLFEQAPVAIGILRGPDYVIEVANPLVAQLWGRTPAELLGRPVFEALPEARDQGFKELLDGVRRSGEAYVAEGVATQLRRGDALQTVYLNYVYQPLRDAAGAVTSVAAVGTDVTAQVRDRQRVQELNEQLQCSNVELGISNTQLTRTNVDLDNFIYTASHDLKAPISNIEGLLYLLQSELPAAVAQEEVIGFTLDRMLDSVDRFKRTIDHLTDVSKLQKENSPDTTAVNLAAVVEDVRQDLRPLLEETGTKLFLDIAATPPIHFAEKNLRSVVYNLLSNAVKYRHPDRLPRVDVRAHVRAGHTVLEVHDNGLGLTPDQVPRLFAMFQRFHDHVEGTGVGLYMVKRMVENGGGRIEVHSQLGAGTTFFVYLPQTPQS